MNPVWFDEPQFPPLIIGKNSKSEKKIPIDGFEAYFENTEKILPPTPKTPRKSKQTNVISEQEKSNSSKCNETDGNTILGVIQEEEINLFSGSCRWEHLSEFEGRIKDSSDNDWLP